MQRIRYAILDWSGTLVGKHGKEVERPFTAAFAKAGIQITKQEARHFMGLPKLNHFEATLQLPSVVSKWREEKKRSPDVIKDSKLLHSIFEPLQLEELSNPNNIRALPKVISALELMSSMGIKFGLTTGFNTKMTNTILHHSPDNIGSFFGKNAIISTDHTHRGRPNPDGIFISMIAIGATSVLHGIKVGDTQNDILEGHAAGLKTCAVTQYSNFAGMFTDDIDTDSKWKQHSILTKVEEHIKEVQATYICHTLMDVAFLIDFHNREV